MIFVAILQRAHRIECISNFTNLVKCCSSQLLAQFDAQSNELIEACLNKMDRAVEMRLRHHVTVEHIEVGAPAALLQGDSAARDQVLQMPVNIAARHQQLFRYSTSSERLAVARR